MERAPAAQARANWRSWFGAIGLAFVCFCGLCALAIYRHETFRSNALDLGYLDQVVWNTAHGRLFANTVKGAGWPSYLAGHFAPALALLAPLYWIWDDVRILFVVQAAALSLAGLPVYAVLRERGKGLALAVLAAFYLNPWLHRGNLHDFHTMLLAAPLMALAVYGIIRRRYNLMGIVLLASLPIKEDMGLVLGLFGVYLLLFRRRSAWRWGLVLLILGAAWLLLTTMVFIPSFAAQGEYRIVGVQYAFLGNSLTEAGQTLLGDPLILFRQVLRRDKLLAFVQLLASMAFLPLLGRGLLVIALPLVAYLQLSDSRGLALLWQWHVATYLPVYFGALALGVARLPRRWPSVAAVVLLLASASAFALDGSVVRLLQEPGMEPDRRLVARSLIAQILPEASVSAQDELLPHLSHRKEIYLFPTVEEADYILMDRYGSTYPLDSEDYAVFWQAAQDPPNYTRVYDDHGFLLLRRQVP